MELIWYRDWLFIGHDCELPKPGSYITVQIGDYPVVLVRDQQGKHQRLPQFLPPSRLPRLQHRQGHGGQARLSLSPVDLRARRPAAVRPPDGRRFRQEPVRPEAGRLAKASAATSSSAWPKSPRISQPMRAMIEPYLMPHRLQRSQGRLREHDRREGQLEARLGKQPRVLPLRRQPSGALQDLPGSADGDRRAGRRQRSGDRRRIGRNARRPACRANSSIDRGRTVSAPPACRCCAMPSATR